MKNYRVMGLVLATFLVCLAGTAQAVFVPNGDFSSGLDGWTVQEGWTAESDDGSPDGPSARSSAYAWLYQPGAMLDPTFVAGETYELSFLAILLDGAIAPINAGITTGAREHAAFITPTNTWQEYSVLFTAEAADVGAPYQPQFCGVAGSIFGIDSVTLDIASEPVPDPDLSSGLQGYWRFEEVNGSGYYVDESPSGNDCIADKRVETLATAPSIIPGVVGNAIHVGFNDFVHTIDDSPVSGNEARTYSFWFNADYAQTQALMSTGTYGDSGSIVEIFLQESEVYSAHFLDAGTMGDPDPTYTAGEWTMATLVYDGNNGYLVYKNGVLSETGHSPFPLNTTLTDICFGGSNTNGSNDLWDYEGSIDEAAIWNRVLTADEIAALYSLGIAGNPIPLATPKIPGDANNDGKVDGSDVTILAGNWQVGVDGVVEASWEMGDFNGDKKVDGSDVTILAGNWQRGVTAAASAVPEPGTVTLLMGVLLSIFWVRCRNRQN